MVTDKGTFWNPCTRAKCCTSCVECSQSAFDSASTTLSHTIDYDDAAGLAGSWSAWSDMDSGHATNFVAEPCICCGHKFYNGLVKTKLSLINHPGCIEFQIRGDVIQDDGETPAANICRLQWGGTSHCGPENDTATVECDDGSGSALYYERNFNTGSKQTNVLLHWGYVHVLGGAVDPFVCPFAMWFRTGPVPCPSYNCCNSDITIDEWEIRWICDSTDPTAGCPGCP